MAPQTRSHTRSSAGVSYKSTPAAPKQQIFPHRRHIVKTYGRSRTVRRDPKQSTLTQMDFVSPSIPDDLLVPEDDDDLEDSEAPAPVAVKAARPKKRAREPRRQTTGDELAVNAKPRDAKRRKTLGDIPSSNRSSNLHTQTLTQMLPAKEGEDEENVLFISDSEAENDADTIIETPTKAVYKTPSKVNGPMPDEQAEVRSSVPSLIRSVTPINRIKLPGPSIPPTTAARQELYGLAPPDKSPLTSKSTNISAPPPIIRSIHKTPRDRAQVIPDTYSTSRSSPTTPTSRSTVKKLRFADDEDLLEDLPDDKENITPGRKGPKVRKPPRQTPDRAPLQEVLDSQPLEDPDPDPPETTSGSDRTVPDSDEDDFDETEDEQAEEVVDDVQDLPPGEGGNVPLPDDPQAAETLYGGIGVETQAELILSVDQLTREIDDSDSTESCRSRSVTPTPTSKQKGTPRQTQVSRTSAPPSTPIVEETPLSSPKHGRSDEKSSKAQTQMFTQGFESQRLPLEAIHALGPLTHNSDIMVSLHPGPLARILDGTKNHEFRSWCLPDSVTRVWIYSTRPHSELKYMFTLGPPKHPGEIQDEDGIGNAEFNQGATKGKYAYEILQVYELNNPVSLAEMREKGWVKEPPQKFKYLGPAIVGELTANLKCALFGGEEQETEDAMVADRAGDTESQELRAQLQGDVEYSTHHPSSSDNPQVIPSSQSSRRAAIKRKQSDIRTFVKPSMSRLQSGSSVQSRSAPPSQIQHSFVRPSQASTVSSPAISPEKSLPRVISISSELSGSHALSSSPLLTRNARTHSLRSSQFQTRSQLLPDSLINDEIQEPPPIIWDSADEQSD
ncbi:hypothetical protein GGR54DRAFT_589033 [Hypoxylon sp. NC1633]|nr:hypothetical protein GGR54DRAFT_589033 [Hypoxylon sp. NC1633]